MSLVLELQAVNLSVMAGRLRVGAQIGLHGCTPFMFIGNSCRKTRLRLCLELIGAPSNRAPRGGSPYLTTLFTSTPILASSSAVSLVKAKAFGHMVPSS